MSGTSTARVAVVASTHDRPERLDRLLEALREQTLPRSEFEVVIVDDGSGRETAAVLERAAQAGNLALSWIRLNESRGAAFAREQGWRDCEAPVIAFTDDDCEPLPTWLERGLDALSHAPDTFVQGVTLPNPAESDRVGPFSRTIRIESLDPNFNTCNIFYPRDLLERSGGFDYETFDWGAGGEDSDLAWRIIGLGGKPLFLKDAVVYHAVNVLSPHQKLRVASRPMDGYGMHPELRRQNFVLRIFWKWEHLLLSAAVLGGCGRRLPTPLRLLLVGPYARNLRARLKVLGGGPRLIVFHLIYDLVEVAATVRAGLRHRAPMI